MTIPRIPQLAILLTLTTFIAGTGYLISHQVLRMSANDPQIQLAEDAAGRMTEGENAPAVLPELRVDIASSLAPFVIVYDDSGRPIASSAYLDGSIPAPPRGVFEFVRSNREERVTWQPRPGVRIASVMTRTARGFVVAGRNMREVEVREALVFKLAGHGLARSQRCANRVVAAHAALRWKQDSSAAGNGLKQAAENCCVRRNMVIGESARPASIKLYPLWRASASDAKTKPQPARLVVSFDLRSMLSEARRWLNANLSS